MTEASSDPRAAFLDSIRPAGESRRVVRRLLTLAVNGRRGEGSEIPDWEIPDWEGLEETSVEADSSRGISSRIAELAERASLLSRERESLPARLSHLLGLGSLPAREQCRLLLSDPAFHSWAFCEWLIEECRDLTHAEAKRANVLAHLAVSLTECLSAERYGEALINDLRARSWACAGHVLLNLADLHGADEALEKAETFLDEGTGDRLEEAHVLEARAALLQNREQLSEAHLLIGEVVDIYRQCQDLHLVGRAFVRKGEISVSAQDLPAGIRWLRKGLGLLDPAREQRLGLAARLSLMLALHESGRNREAWFLLKASRSEIQQSGGELLSLRLLWLEGKIQQALGLPMEAERSLVEARRGFIAQGVGFDAAASTLDLALLYAGQGRSSEMRRLAEEMLATASARDLHREALAAVIIFQQAVWMDRVSSDLLLDLRAYLHRARKDSRLRFEARA
jgi:tetratricopeptide (TPR) repeat protein